MFKPQPHKPATCYTVEKVGRLLKTERYRNSVNFNFVALYIIY